MEQGNSFFNEGKKTYIAEFRTTGNNERTNLLRHNASLETAGSIVSKKVVHALSKCPLKLRSLIELAFIRNTLHLASILSL